jgi:hypothetical protein
MVALWLAVWRVLAVNATFGPAGEGKALYRAHMRPAWTWAGRFTPVVANILGRLRVKDSSLWRAGKLILGQLAGRAGH